MNPKAQEFVEKSGWREIKAEDAVKVRLLSMAWCGSHELAVAVLTHQNPWAGSIQGKPSSMEEERAPEATPLAEEQVAVADCLNGVPASFLQNCAL